METETHSEKRGRKHTIKIRDKTSPSLLFQVLIMDSIDKGLMLE